VRAARSVTRGGARESQATRSNRDGTHLAQVHAPHRAVVAGRDAREAAVDLHPRAARSNGLPALGLRHRHHRHAAHPAHGRDPAHRHYSADGDAAHADHLLRLLRPLRLRLRLLPLLLRLLRLLRLLPLLRNGGGAAKAVRHDGLHVDRLHPSRTSAAAAAAAPLYLAEI
jgi:hypothetical protein